MNIIVKRILAIIVALFIIGVTFVGALAYSIDGDDELYLTKDSTLEGTFVIEDFENNIDLKSNMEWISLDETKYISEKLATGTKIIDENYLISYYVNIPATADIGVYRGTIEVIQGNEVQYLNVKLSVQNSLVTNISKTFQNPKTRIPLIVGFSIILFILLLLTFRRAKNAK